VVTTPKPLAQNRVLWVSHGYGYEGDLLYFGEIFREFRKRHPQMAVVTDPATRYRNPYAITLLPIMKLVRRKLKRTSPEGEIYETETAFPTPFLFWQLARQKPDVLITIEFTPPALIATALAAMSKRRRLVLLIESDPAARGASRNPVLRRIKRWAARRADIVQTSNAPGRRYLVEDLGVTPEKVIVAPYLTSRPPGPEACLDVQDGPLRLLFINSLTARKGLAALLDALALLPAASRADLELTVVGNGPLRADHERQAAELKMGPRLRFEGRKNYDELGVFYAAADVLAIPSLADYRSLAGFEGLGYGLVLLASRYDGATDETVAEGVNGYVIDPRQPEQIASRIEALRQDRAKVQQMRKASLALYNDHFSVERIAANVANSVERALLTDRKTSDLG
jgi:glycosyltransferase involved in cell wall biosynthesis